MARKTCKIVTQKGEFFHVSSQNAKLLRELGFIRVIRHNPFIAELTLPEKYANTFAEPGVFRNSLIARYRELEKMGKRKGSKTQPPKRVYCECGKWAMPKSHLCTSCHNEVVLLEKLWAGDAEAVEMLLGENNGG